MPTALVNGVRLNFLQVEEAGAGVHEHLFMLHGLATNMAFWYLPYAQVFSQRYRVTLLDMRGMGRSQRTADGYTPEDLGRDVLGLMDQLGIERAHFVAHSFGGVVALNVARLRADRVQSLVLADTHIAAARHREGVREWGRRQHIQGIVDRHGLALDTLDPYFGYRLLKVVAELQLEGREVPEELLALVGPMMGKHGNRTAQQWLGLMRDTAAERELMGDDGLDLATLRTMHFPIMALYGDHSQARLTGSELLEVWPHAAFRRVRDAGHFFPISRPAEVMRECERFWSGEFAHRPPVRRSDRHLRRHFRSDRVFKADAAWYYTPREAAPVGPFDTRDAAHEALARYISSLAHAA